MAYDHQMERKRQTLLDTLGVVSPMISIMELWDRYLTAIGFAPTVGQSVLDRMVRAAAAQGVPLTKFIEGAGALGPELAPVVGVDTGAYVLTGNAGPVPTHDAGGIHFAAAVGQAAATYTAADGVLTNDAVFRIQFTIANYSGGTGRVLVYGDNSNHLASTSAAGCAGNANGQCSVFRATSSTGANFDEIRVQCQTGLCTFDITQVSVRKVI